MPRSGHLTVENMSKWQWKNPPVTGSTAVNVVFFFLWANQLNEWVIFLTATFHYTKVFLHVCCFWCSKLDVSNILMYPRHVYVWSVECCKMLPGSKFCDNSKCHDQIDCYFHCMNCSVSSICSWGRHVSVVLVMGANFDSCLVSTGFL